MVILSLGEAVYFPQKFDFLCNTSYSCVRCATSQRPIYYKLQRCLSKSRKYINCIANPTVNNSVKIFNSYAFEKISWNQSFASWIDAWLILMMNWISRKFRKKNKKKICECVMIYFFPPSDFCRFSVKWKVL